MSAPVAVGVIGGGRHAAALADHQAPLPHAAVVCWAPRPDGDDRSVAAGLAGRIGAQFLPEWEGVARNPSLPAILVLSDGPDTAATVAALEAGKVVLRPAPAATLPEEVDRLATAQARGRGMLLTPGAIRHTPAGREGLRLITGGALGTLHSAFACVRMPMAPAAAPGAAATRRPPAILEDAGWEIFDYFLAVTAAHPVRVHAHVTTLFGPGAADTAICIVRFEGDLIATVELSRCLPPSLPVSDGGEIEIEVIGARETVRLEPYKSVVHVYGTGAVARPWLDAPVISMLREAIDAVDGARSSDGVAEARRAVVFMEAVHAAAERSARLLPDGFDDRQTNTHR